MIPQIYIAQMLQQQMSAYVTAVDRLKTPPIETHDAEKIKTLLKKHGCQIEEHADHNEIIFPPGTKRYRGLRVVVSELHDILLPDGYIIHESYDTARALSFLYFEREGRMAGEKPTYKDLWYDQKCTLLDIWAKTTLDANDLTMLWNHYPVLKEVAQSALQEYNQLFGTDYTLEQVDIPVIETPSES